MARSQPKIKKKPLRTQVRSKVKHPLDQSDKLRASRKREQEIIRRRKLKQKGKK